MQRVRIITHIYITWYCYYYYHRNKNGKKLEKKGHIYSNESHVFLVKAIKCSTHHTVVFLCSRQLFD